MTPFLETVAAQYIKRYDNLSDFCFVFPNKRSGTFFLNYIQELSSDKPRVAPDITTVSEIISRLADKETDSRIGLLFTLYDTYCEILKERNAGEIPDFESFASWGEVALRDFSEADLYDVDPSQLFSNVRKHKEISSNFLTEEQTDVLNEYFGVARPSSGVSDFWKYFDYQGTKKRHGDEATPQIKARFLSLWQLLAPLYERLNERLEKEGLTTQGGLYRAALKKLRDEGHFPSDAKKLVFVGFNILSKIEWMIFYELMKMHTEINGSEECLADFIWDIQGPLLAEGTAGAKYVRRNLKTFPMPDWIDLSPCCPPDDKLPEIEIIASPSNSLQAKIAAQIAADLNSACKNDDDDNDFSKDSRLFADAKAAIVLPDESLLLPLLYAIPPTLHTINLTMGHSLRLTATITFIDRIKRLQLHKTSVSGTTAFFHEDVAMLLSHPFTSLILGSRDVADIKNRIAKLRKFAVTAEDVYTRRDNPHAARLFRMIKSDGDTDEVFNYLHDILSLVNESIDTVANSALVSENDTERYKLDKIHIGVYRDALRQLQAAIARHNLKIKPFTVFSLADRLLAGETVSFEGEPLEGLQVMGLLETRSLDFDYLIIPSMNEKAMPRRVRRKSFIPESIRRGFGMPSSGYEESIFAYYFYRLISRAKKVCLIYDSRVGENRGGEPSRYIHQLRHLYAPGRLSESKYSFSLASSSPQPFVIPKDSAIIHEILARFSQKDSGYNFSASLLSQYCICSMRFFYSKILGIREEQEPSEFIDPLTQGSIFHAVMEELYMPDPDDRGHLLTQPRILTRETLETILSDKTRITNLITRHTNILFHKADPASARADATLSGEPAMTAGMIMKWVTDTLQKDINIAPIKLFGVEINKTISVPVGNNMINFTFAIDRYDEININGSPVRRIIDYKTGKAHFTAQSPEDIFNGEYEARNILQPILYAYLLNYTLNGTLSGQHTIPLRPEIYSMQPPGKDNPPIPSIRLSDDDQTPTDISLHTQADSFFLEKLENLINDILRPDGQFSQTDYTADCTFCPYARLCFK